MPIDSSRFGNPEIEGNDERLPGDRAGEPIQWVCQQCDAVQQGRPELGCGVCGAGKPGQKAKLPPSLEELQGEAGERRERRGGWGAPSGRGQVGSTPARSTRLADRLMTHAEEHLLQQIRMIVREELRDAFSPQRPWSPEERRILLEGIQLVQIALQHTSQEEREKEGYPSPEAVVKLFQAIDQEPDKEPT